MIALSSLPEMVLRGVSGSLFTSGKAFAWKHELAFPDVNVRYTYIPKNGCSSFKLSLGIAEGWLRPGDDPHSIRIRHRLYGKATTDSCAPRFVILRDPGHRVASAFLDRFSKPADHATDTLIEQGLLRRGEVLGDITFERFLEHISSQSRTQMDQHWRPQEDFLYGNYSKTFSFDRISDALNWLQTLGVEPRSCRPHATSGFAPLGAYGGSVSAETLVSLREQAIAPTYNEMLNPSSREMIQTIYARDYELLNNVTRS